MALRETLVRQGNWLFRWRSYMPLVLLAPLCLAITDPQWPTNRWPSGKAWEFACLLLAFAGFAARILTTGYAPDGTSGRNTRHQVAYSLNTTGIYSLVRHPLYLGNFLVWLAMALFCGVWWFTTLYVLAFWLYYERIILAEEDFLRRKFGEAFDVWASKTPAFIPRLSRWTRPATPFSLRRVLRKEYTGLFGIVAGFFTLQLVSHLLIDHKPLVEPAWAALGSVALITYLTLRTLKKHTTLLRSARSRAESAPTHLVVIHVPERLVSRQSACSPPAPSAPDHALQAGHAHHEARWTHPTGPQTVGVTASLDSG
jgi:protein-S-isoprenylcysteine O-methyltransferase Ste14